jgi:L-fuconolactonase
MLPTKLVYDILIFARQLPEATRFVDRHPQQSFVLDHIAKPDIKANTFSAWDLAIRNLALRPNVTCKLSGMVTEADWHTWSPAQLQPYFDTVLEAFGPSRLMFGSDWPVLAVASTYSRWVETVDTWLAPLTPAERAQIEGETATRVYRLT